MPENLPKQSPNVLNLSNARRVSGAYTPARIARAAAEAAAAQQINKQAERIAQRRKAKNPTAPKSKKKMQGYAFWGIIFLAVLKDLSDIVLDLSVVFAFFVIATGLAISFVVAIYLFMEDVPMSTRTLALFTISLVIDIIPFISLLPTFSLSLFLIRYLENNEKTKKVMGLRAKAA